ncbi:transcriptional regulator with XRE-family HTH domain [Catalinimonas alkaloidigena]|uniref:helix-turn-helix domain-containing protein n=1 Tax=Catalinimonas alkaloidigena TaxID=1075417 RepID=UPI0024065E96|nr:helix-turn-helix domain-containing protein [Catalinimonas alkaloidigena]MDF9799738.1 transcriptional regulator with XRE-family HTH domain [Catalinimonas alkaloidigena]
MTNIGSRISEARKAASISATELAKQLGKTSSTISQYESERIKVGIDTLVQISEICNVDLYWLLTGKGKKMVKEDDLVDEKLIAVSSNHSEKIDVDVLAKIKNEVEDIYKAQIEDLKKQLLKAEEEKNRFINIVEKFVSVKPKVTGSMAAVVREINLLSTGPVTLQRKIAV